jgi:isochorismate pyruvate lyase
MSFRRAFSGTPWEKEVGYCRAVRAGDLIFVTGTAPMDPNGEVHAPGDPYRQARRCFEIIQQALRDLDSDIQNVVRTRMFVTDISLWEDFGRAHKEFFADHPPACSSKWRQWLFRRKQVSGSSISQDRSAAVSTRRSSCLRQPKT